MADQSIDNEIQENQQRQSENEANAEEDGSIVDGFEKAINPLVDNFDIDGNDAPNDDDIARQRTLNDTEQRPD
jgi:hypothetical protein